MRLRCHIPLQSNKIRALQDARGKARDTSERARIETASEEVSKRAGRLAMAIDKVAALRAKQEAYQERIAALDARIAKIVGRTYRGSQRWLRHWKNL